MRTQAKIIPLPRCPGKRLPKLLIGPMPKGIERGGFMLQYHVGQFNRCPSCECTQWHVGRVTAECAGCGFPLPIKVKADQ